MSLALWQQDIKGFMQRQTAPPEADACGDLTTLEAFQIYRNNLELLRQKVLSSHFPIVKALVGDACFQGMVARYIEDKPTPPHRLHEEGQSLATWLLQQSYTDTVPYLADVAKLEWALVKANEGHREVPCGLTSLGATTDIKLQLWPWGSLIKSDFPLYRLWRYHQAHHGDETMELLQKERYYWIDQQRGQACIHPISSAIWQGLSLITAQTTLQALIDAWQQEGVLDVMLSLLPQLVEKGWLLLTQEGK